LWREDESNDDLAHPRNRVRHELLPYLRQHFNPAVDAALARLADAARVDDIFLQSAVTECVEWPIITQGRQRFLQPDRHVVRIHDPTQTVDDCDELEQAIAMSRARAAGCPDPRTDGCARGACYPGDVGRLHAKRPNALDLIGVRGDGAHL